MFPPGYVWFYEARQTATSAAPWAAARFVSSEIAATAAILNVSTVEDRVFLQAPVRFSVRAKAAAHPPLHREQLSRL